MIDWKDKLMVDWKGCKMVDLMGKLTVGKKVDMMVEWMVVG